MVNEQFSSLEEKRKWIEFLGNAYKEDRKLAEDVILKFPRWSIIAGYYAMHDLAKLYLAKAHNIKITGEGMHAETLFLLKQHLAESDEKKKIISLLEEADEEYSILRQGKVHLLLKQGKDERASAQYYLGRNDDMFNREFSRNASYFLEKLVDVFIRIMEKMI